MRAIERNLFASALLAMLCALSGNLRAQALYGSIVGTVTDTSGAVVPDATVKATQTGTGQVRETQTNETGAYTFPNLPTGTYNITVGRAGFANFIRQGGTVTIDNVVRVDVGLT